MFGFSEAGEWVLGGQGGKRGKGGKGVFFRGSFFAFLYRGFLEFRLRVLIQGLDSGSCLDLDLDFFFVNIIVPRP